MIEAPARRSKSARNPFVVIGNAIISLFVLAAIVAGIALVSGKQRFEAAGPLPMTTNGLRALFERRAGASIMSGSKAVRGLRGVIGLKFFASMPAVPTPLRPFESGG